MSNHRFHAAFNRTVFAHTFHVCEDSVHVCTALIGKSNNVPVGIRCPLNRQQGAVLYVFCMQHCLMETLHKLDVGLLVKRDL